MHRSSTYPPYSMSLTLVLLGILGTLGTTATPLQQAAEKIAFSSFRDGNQEIYTI